MGIFGSRQPSEREIVEKRNAKSGIPALHPLPGYEGRCARYIVRHPSGRPEMDRWGLGHVIRPGGRTLQQEVDEEENRIMRQDMREDRPSRRRSR